MATSSSLRWLPSLRRHCSRRRLLRRAGDRESVAPPTIFTMEQLQRVDDDRHASPRHTSRVCPAQKAVSAGKTGSSPAQNPRSFLIHTRSFTVTGWGHVLLKQRLGLVVVDIHWPAKPRSLGGGEQFFLHSSSRESLRRGFHGQLTPSNHPGIIAKRPALQHCKARGIRGTAIGRPG